MNSRPYFSRTFFWPQYDFVKKSPRKKSLLTSEKCMIHNSRFFFSSDLFSLWVFIPGILFPETLLAAPHAILGKKVPRNPKQRTLFSVTFFQGFYKIQTLFLKVFISWFFPETFFLGTFLHRFNGQNYKMFNVIKYPKLQFFLFYIYCSYVHLTWSRTLLTRSWT